MSHGSPHWIGFSFFHYDEASMVAHFERPSSRGPLCSYKKQVLFYDSLDTASLKAKVPIIPFLAVARLSLDLST